MSWLQKLYETYENCVQDENLTKPALKTDGTETLGLLPVSHISQQAHICIAIDHKGNFIRAELLPPKTSYIVPATEDSASRSGKKPPPHPLADKIRYCAKDYVGEQENFFAEYHALLGAWCDSPHAHPKAQAVYAYISKGIVVKDLIKVGLLFQNDFGKLLTAVPKEFKEKDTIFKRITKKDQGDAFVLWRVIIPEDMQPDTWKDKSLQEAWRKYDFEQEKIHALCALSGFETSIMTKHPRNIRRSGDGAKLISSNDDNGFTYRGRLVEPENVCTVGYEASYKAHNALRWLIERQGYRTGDQAIVAWAVNGLPLPQPCVSLLELIEDDDLFATDDIEVSADEESVTHADMGQSFAKKLGNALRGYRADLSNTKDISIIALDSASPGRLSVTFYRSQLPQEYLDKLQAWQEDFVWSLSISPKKKNEDAKVYIRAPLPLEIVKGAYGSQLCKSKDDKLIRKTIARLLPCIVDGVPFPRDLVDNCYYEACKAISTASKVKSTAYKKDWLVEIGIACAVYKGYYARHPQLTKRRKYTMSLDEERTSRDYLYGRLLAVAEYYERCAHGEEKRPTNAERLLTRFADRPFATWHTIETQLNPYLCRLQNTYPKTYVEGKKWLQDICNAFEPDDFTNDAKLSGEFLLAYHCQLSVLYTPKNKENTATEEGASHE